jgi:hypothetical protein
MALLQENHVRIFAKIFTTKEAARSQSRLNFPHPLFTPSEVLRSIGLYFFFPLAKAPRRLRQSRF